VIDNAFINFFSTKFSRDYGRLLEKLVGLKLVKESYEDPMVEVFYWRDYSGREVDFIVKKGVGIEKLIQVTYASERSEVEKREIEGLIKASRNLNCKNLVVITWNYQGEETIENKRVKFIPLWKWLLNPV